MKKRILLIFVCLFGMLFSSNYVMAASELSCVYTPEVGDSYVFIQKSNGSNTLYYYDGIINNDSILQSSENWHKLSNYSVVTTYLELEDGYVDNNGNLLKCPAQITFEDDVIEMYYEKLYDRKDSLNLYKQINGSIFSSGGGENIITYSCSEIKNMAENANYFLYTPNPSVYKQTCLYITEIEHPNLGSDYSVCVIYQLEYNDSEVNGRFFVSDANENFVETSDNKFELGNNITLENLKPYFKYDYACPPTIFGSNGGDPYNYSFSTLKKNLGVGKFELYKVNEVRHSDYSLIINDNQVNIDNCDDLLSKDIVNLLSKGVTILRVLIPIVLLVLGIVDFASAIFAGKDNDMKKTASRFIKRVIICVVIFLVPTVLGLVLKIAHLIWPNISPDLCGII